MTEIFGYNREAVRVKVKKCEPNIPPEWRKFSVDPQITSLEVLYSILAKAFDIKSDFSICYKTLDPTGHEAYLSVLSDWELDAAFSKAHNISIQTGNEPCLNLRVDIKAFSEATDWEVSSQITKEISSLQQSFGVGQKYVQNMQNKLPGLIMNQMEKTFSMVQRALNLNDDQVLSQPPRPPLSDSEFRSFLDSVGQILQPHELRRVIFAGGIDPSLRKVVWKHILNVYPTGMTGKERMDYMKRKAGEYYRLREVWKSAVQRGPVTGELGYVTSMVRKDVLRTDRLHSFYAGSDDNQNIASLFNILTTYALNHPSVSYCQGMSDIASPLLVTMSDEAHAYICFCAIMGRLKANFMLDGIAMTLKFTHLAEALHFYDPEFYSYLKLQQADDLLFCYRWLLLEMKREFAFDDSLRMLEVLWSSLRYEPPTKELSLFEKEFEPSPPDIPPPKSPSVILRTPRENHYTKVCALRRQSSSVSLLSSSPNSINSSLSSVFSSYGGSIGGKLNATRRLNHSLDENISRLPRTKSVKAHQSLDETKMIMLMENMALLENKLTTEITQQHQQQQQKLQNKESQQQQHQNKEETIIMNNQEINQKIIFHPTNPFIDDTNSELRQHDENKNESNNRIKCSTNIDDNLSNDSSEERTLSPKRDFKYKTQKNNLKLQNKNIFSCNANNISKQLTNKKGGHFKELKEKIAASKKGILASLDKIESQFEVTSKQAQNLSNSQILDDSLKCDNTIITTTTTTSSASSKGQKVVKNFNEFLNFASINKSRISDKLVTNNKINSTFNSNNNKDITKDNGINKHQPLIKLTKNSFDDSDSSVTCETEVSQLQLQQQNQTISVQPSITSITTVTTTTTEISSKQPLQLHLTNIVAQTQQNLDGSSPDDSQDYYPMTTSMTRELRLELENLDRQVFGNVGILERNKFLNEDITDIEYEKLDKDSLDMLEVRGEEIISCPDLNEIIVMRNNQEKKNITSNNDPLKRISTCSTGTDIFIWENPLHQISGASSCNFNEIIENNDDENAIIKNENGISRCDDDGCGYIDDNNKINSVQQTALTPDEQQELEYDGEIIIESEFKKSVTPLKLVQTTTTTTTSSSSASLHSTKLHDYDDSDSDNTDSWKKSDNLNPFLQSKSSSIIDRFEAQKEQQQQEEEQQSKKKLPQQQPKIQNHVLSVFVEQPPQQLQQQQNQNLQSTELINNSISSSASNITTNLQQTTTVEEASETNIINLTTSKTIINNILPPPDEFGGGNPFLMFLCLTLLLQHRNYVIKNAMDYNEMAMHFDKMVRKHDVNRVLNQARRMYFEYLKTQNALISSSLTLNSNSDTFHGHSNKL